MVAILPSPIPSPAAATVPSPSSTTMTMTMTIDPARAAYDDSPLLIKVSVVMPVLSVAVVLLRVWARRIGRMALGMDDWLIVLAQAFSFGIPVAAVLSALHGVGKHIEVVEAKGTDDMQWVMGILFVGELAYVALIALIKVSILMLYLKVFPTPYMRKAAILTSVLLALWTVGCMFVTIFQCNPITAAWDKSLLKDESGARCVNQGAYFIGVAAPHTATDVLILALPLFELRKLQMPKWKKVAIAGIFLLGGFIVVVSIIRLTTLIAMYDAGDSADTTMLLMPVELWTVTEVSVAIICACLPTLGPLISKYGPAAVHILSTRRKEGGGRESNDSEGSGSNGISKPLASPSSSAGGSGHHHQHHHHLHHKFSTSRSGGCGFRRLADGGNGDRAGRNEEYPIVTPEGYENDVEISASGGCGVGAAVGDSSRGCRCGGDGGGGGGGGKRGGGGYVTNVVHLVEADEIPLQGIHVKQDMVWQEECAETRR